MYSRSLFWFNKISSLWINIIKFYEIKTIAAPKMKNQQSRFQITSNIRVRSEHQFLQTKSDRIRSCQERHKFSGIRGSLGTKVALERHWSHGRSGVPGRPQGPRQLWSRSRPPFPAAAGGRAVRCRLVSLTSRGRLVAGAGLTWRTPARTHCAGRTACVIAHGPRPPSRGCNESD